MQFFKFIIIWFAIFAASYVGLSALGFVPTEVEEFNFRTIENIKSLVFPRAAFVEELAIKTPDSETEVSFSEIVLPERMIIPKINVDFPVKNPETKDPVVLDQALLSGIVRYPGSGGLHDDSNMLLFGHSTTFSVVKHEAYKALNHLEQLSLGDEVRLYSGTTEYVYTVSSVSSIDKEAGLVKLATGERMITLSTCDTFGQNAKRGRIIVEAKFVQSREVGALPVEKNQ